MPRLNKIQGKVALGSKWFSSLVDRVEEIKPLAGDGIKLEQTTDGITIGLDSGSQGKGGMQIYEINVCINGKPSTLDVYGPEDQ